jgi:hypothetical protein
VGQAAPSKADQPVKRHHALSLIGLGAALGYTVYALLPTAWGALRLRSKAVYRLDHWLNKMFGQ